MVNQAKATIAALVASLGAFLFGLDIGYIAPILGSAGFKRDVAHLANWNDTTATIPAFTEGFIVGIFSVGCIITASPPVSSFMIDESGRRNSIIFGGVIFLVGCALQAEATSVALFLAGRLVTGFAIGLLSSVVPLYQAEMAPPHLRGTLTSLYNLMITAGILCASIADQFLVQQDNGWRLAIWLQAIPTSIILASMPFLPRSPRWLVEKGHREEAELTLLELRAGWSDGKAPIDRLSTPELAINEAAARQELKEIVEEHEAEWASSNCSRSWAEVFTGRVGTLVLIGATLQMLQQLVGMNAFMYFGPSIFSSFGLEANLFQTLSNTVNFIATFPALYLVEAAGRRSLLMAGSMAMAGSCIILATLGQQFLKHVDKKWISTDSSIGPAMAAMVFTFVASFACSWGPVVWVYCAEIFPLKYRARCLGVTTMTNWVGNYVIAQFTPILLARFGFSTFYVFGCFCILAFAFASWLPETSGVSLEHITEVFDAKFGSSEEASKGLETKFRNAGYGSTALHSESGSKTV